MDAASPRVAATSSSWMNHEMNAAGNMISPTARKPAWYADNSSASEAPSLPFGSIAEITVAARATPEAYAI